MINITPLTEAIRHVITKEFDDGWRKSQVGGKSLWLIPNEVSGFTLMFPDEN